jgi:methanogenic corrinoid protein MtbC1
MGKSSQNLIIPVINPRKDCDFMNKQHPSAKSSYQAPINLITPDVFEAYFSSLISGKKKNCYTVVEELMQNDCSITDVYINLFQNSLYKVGKLWEANVVSVAVEHVATAITEGLLALMYPKLSAMPKHGRKAVVACVSGERHQIGGRMVADILELHGWDSHYLGANTPNDDLLDMLETIRPDLLGLSLSLSDNKAKLLTLLHGVRTRYPHLCCITGGKGLSGNRLDLGIHGCIPILADIQELDHFLRHHANA